MKLAEATWLNSALYLYLWIWVPLLGAVPIQEMEVQLCNYQIVFRWVSTAGVANRVTSNFRSLLKSDQNYYSRSFVKLAIPWWINPRGWFCQSNPCSKEMLLPFDQTFRDLMAWPAWPVLALFDIISGFQRIRWPWTCNQPLPWGMDHQPSSHDLLEIALLWQDLCSNLGMCKGTRRYKLCVFVTLLASFLNFPVSNSQTSVKPEANWMARMLLLFPAVHRALSAGHASLIVSRALWKLEMLQVVEIWAKNCQTMFFLKGDIEDHGKTSFQDLLEESSSFNLFSSSKRQCIEKMVPAETPDSKHMKIT